MYTQLHDINIDISFIITLGHINLSTQLGNCHKTALFLSPLTEQSPLFEPLEAGASSAIVLFKATVGFEDWPFFDALLTEVTWLLMVTWRDFSSMLTETLTPAQFVEFPFSFTLFRVLPERKINCNGKLLVGKQT